MNKILLVTICCISTLIAAVPIMKTGMTHIHIAGDDGSYQLGLDRNYTRSSEGIVTDHSTHLQWQDTQNHVGKPRVIQANYNNGDYYNYSGDTADSYCANLDLNGTGWRLPTFEELSTLYEFNLDVEKLPDVFVYNPFHSTWSSTDGGSDVNSRYIHFHGSDMMNWTLKYYANIIKCVRPGPGYVAITDNFIRNDVNNTVFDQNSELEWQDEPYSQSEIDAYDDENETEKVQKLPGAIAYCESLTLNGKSDWRLPNINELHSLIDYSTQFIHSTFVNNPQYATISSTLANSTDYIWTASSDARFYSRIINEDGEEVDCGEYEYPRPHYVRCVRGGESKIQTPSSPKPHPSPALIYYLLNN